jgi:hypothetical protein
MYNKSKKVTLSAKKKSAYVCCEDIVFKQLTCKGFFVKVKVHFTMPTYGNKYSNTLF